MLILYIQVTRLNLERWNHIPCAWGMMETCICLVVLIQIPVCFVTLLIEDWSNQLWKYYTGSQTWTLLSGDQNYDAYAEYYGTLQPGSMEDHTMVMQGNYIYIFGGYGYDDYDYGMV